MSVLVCTRIAWVLLVLAAAAPLVAQSAPDGLPLPSRSLFDDTAVEHLVGLSSPGFEAKPDIGHDLLTLWFASTQEPNEGELDLFVTTRPAVGEAFGPPTNVVELNSSGRDHTPTTNADMTYMVFSSSREGGLGSDDAWESSRPDTDSPWGPPVNIAALNSPERDMGFTMTPDALTLWFSSNRDKPAGELDPDFDIYVSQRASVDDPWPEPVPVDELNTTPFADKFPSVSGDGLALYFASDRPGSVLGDDLSPSQDTWVALRPDTSSPWTVVENVFDNNTKYNEYLISVANDHSELFFVSDRPGTLGGFDLYRVPALAGVLRYGAGTPGVFGTPRLSFRGGDPLPGAPGLELEVSLAPPGTLAMFLVSPDIGPGPLLTSLEPSTLVRRVLVTPSSTFSVPVAIGSAPFLVGATFHVQLLLVDGDGGIVLAGLPGIEWSASPGNRIVVQPPPR